MDERARQRLQDILDANEELQEALAGLTPATFAKTREKQRVTERLLEVAGEAATHVPDEAIAHIEGDWSGLRRMRILLAHAYHPVDAGRLWPAATVSLPQLAKQIRDALG